jgi:putative peptide zinc metalloprotease protein
MSDELFSPQWYRVANLHPRLRKHVRIHRQVHRTRIWYVIEDEATGRNHRLDPKAYAFVGRLDGQVSVDQLWNELLEALNDQSPTQHDIVRLVGQLHQADLVQCELTPDIEELFRRQERRERQLRWGMLNPLAFRTPLFDPTPLLDWLQPKTVWFFSQSALMVWVSSVLLGGIIAVQNWTVIVTHAGTHLPSTRYLFLVWLCYPILKSLHELAHALAVRHWGGNVHEMGVSLLVLMPVPYVDASAATLFSDKYARIIVSAAGIIVEVFFAVLGLIVWLNVSDGVVRDIAFTVMAIGGVSTVMFNGNPLLKFDGYYVLADWLEIPNLNFQIKRYWSWMARRYLLRVKKIDPIDTTPGEIKWLFSYGVLSWFYRFAVMLVIAAWFSHFSLLLAALAVLLFLYSLIIKPVYEILQYLRTSHEIRRHRFRAWISTGGAVAVVAMFLMFVPLPYSTVAQGVVWLPDKAKIRVGVEGFVEDILVADGSQVRRGQPLVRLNNDALDIRKKVAQSKLATLKVRYYASIGHDSAETDQLREEMSTVKNELAQIEKEIDHLIIRSPLDGKLVIPHPEDQPGTLIAKGTTLGYVFARQEIRLRAVIPQADAQLVRHRTESVSVRMADHLQHIFKGELDRAVPSATTTLPSAALAYVGGGNILTDPTDKENLRALEPVFIVDVRVPDHELSRVGGRAWLRFDHGKIPLLSQWSLRWEQLFLQHGAAEG